MELLFVFGDDPDVVLNETLFTWDQATFHIIGKDHPLLDKITYMLRPVESP